MKKLFGILSLAALATGLEAAAPKPAAAAAAVPLPPPASGPVDFARDIQPLFAARCYACHGMEKQKGGLRLDLKVAAMEGGDNGKVILPGKSAESPLIHLVAGVKPDAIMPPKGERLTAAEVGRLRAWIDAGAPWPEDAGSVARIKSSHWAFQSPVRPPVPAGKSAKSAARNPVDAFVQARLEKEKIKPSAEADRYTLIRRLTLDLLGLPPKAEEVQAFLSDRSPEAYERLVDRVLQSPHFGERWGRHWLDLARYADSDGYEKDRPRPFAFTYRDWVINAINRDLPFDQFSIQQLAGDLLADAGHDQQVATGFHRQTLTNTEGGVDQEEFRCRAIVDRVSTTSSVWLGVTLGCAECHTHKYDPFTQREFYQLFAFFNNASEKNIPAPQPAELAAHESARKKWDAENAKLQRALDGYLKSEFPARRDAWLQTASVQLVPWRTLAADQLTAKNGTTLKAGKESIITASGTVPDKETYRIESKPPPGRITAFRLEAIDDPNPKKGPGRHADGNFVLTHFTVQAQSPGAAAREVKLGPAAADFSQAKFPVANALAGQPDSGWAVAPQIQQSHVAVFRTAEPLELPADARLVITLDHQYREGYTLGQFRLAVTDATGPIAPELVPDAVATALALAPEKRSEKQVAALSNHFREQIDTEAGKLKAALDDHGKKAPVFPPTTAAVMVEEASARKTQVHLRGNFLDRGAEAKPGVPAVLHALQPRGERPDRLDLARWLFEPANPLTARVTVNHIWKNLFGRGLVASLDDFGTQGEKPTHPELLEWLATEFPRLGWSRKAMIKLLVTSQTYRQSSRHRPDLLDRDPENRLLARQNRLRLEAESVRDSYLAVSGRLNEKVGGPSIRPPLPADIAALGYANSVKWQESAGTEKNRRGLYIFFQRTVPYPMLMAFDAPDSNTTCARRERSNTPLQALTLLNDPVFFECAQALGERMAAVETSDPFARLRHGFQLCFARPPTAEEVSRLGRLYDRQMELIQGSPESAAKIAGGKPDQPEAAEKAALIALARVLLNLDEFVTRD